MTGLLRYGSCQGAINNAHVLLMLGWVGDVAATLRAVAPMVQDKHGQHFVHEHVA